MNTADTNDDFVLETTVSVSRSTTGVKDTVITLTGSACPMSEETLDPKDPKNWARWRKTSIALLVCADYFMFTFITTMTVSTSISNSLMEKLNASYVQVAEYAVAMPALALAVSPLFWTPLAKTFGRRPVMIFGVAIALISSIGIASTKSYAGYMIARFFQGWGVGPASTVGLQVLQEMYADHERGEKIGHWTLSIDLGLLFGPLIGGFAALAFPDLIAWLSAAIFGVLLILMLVLFDETAFCRPSATQEPSGESVKSHCTQSLPWLNLYQTNVHGLVRSPIWETTFHVVRLLIFPNVAIPIIFYCWTWYLWIMCVITMLPATYPTWSPDKQGLLMIGMIIGTILAEIICSGRLSDRFVDRLSRAASGNRTPEMRLWFFLPAALATASGLVLFGITEQFGWHWIIEQVSLALFAFGVQVGNTTAATYAVECYPAHVMAIIAFYSFHLNLSAFASPFWIVPMTAKIGWAWSFGSQAIIVVVFASICVPFLMVWGRPIHGWKGPLSFSTTE